MNVSEANAYQSLLRWLVDVEASDAADDPAVTDIAWLAGRAHETLADGHTVVTASEQVVPKVLEHRDLVRRALADHQAHGGSIPWPSIRRPFEEWAAMREGDA